MTAAKKERMWNINLNNFFSFEALSWSLISDSHASESFNQDKASFSSLSSFHQNSFIQIFVNVDGRMQGNIIFGQASFRCCCSSPSSSNDEFI